MGNFNKVNPGDVVLVRWECGAGGWKVRPGLVVEIDEEAPLCRVAYGTSKHFSPSGHLLGEVPVPVVEAKKLGLDVATTFDIRQCRTYHVEHVRVVGNITASKSATADVLRELSVALRAEKW